MWIREKVGTGQMRPPERTEPPLPPASPAVLEVLRRREILLAEQEAVLSDNKWWCLTMLCVPMMLVTGYGALAKFTSWGVPPTFAAWMYWGYLVERTDGTYAKRVQEHASRILLDLQQGDDNFRRCMFEYYAKDLLR